MIQTKLLFTMPLEVEMPLQMVGVTPIGDRRIAKVTGGSFAGPEMTGTILPGGGDWLLLRTDGTLQLDVRVILKTDDDALIYMTYRGFRHGPPEVMERLNRGEEVDPSEYYFRIAPFFETGADKYDWLNRIVTVGTGHRLASGPVYEIYQIL
ncbi:MAG: DUF3237 domain-containing protein [Proteobacteria bacterium]|nr:DUF3237 domain-containing protein [Pseudomonadota bacterium]